VAYTIFAAQQSEYIDQVIVSTDCENVGSVASTYGADVHYRHEELAGDMARIEPTILDAAEAFAVTDYICYMQPTDIIRPKWIVDQTCQQAETHRSRCAVVVHPTHKKYWKDDHKRVEPYNFSSKEYIPRQQARPIYREDTGICLVSHIDNWKEFGRVRDGASFVINDDPMSFIDIHDQHDAEMAEIVLSHDSLRTRPRYWSDIGQPKYESLVCIPSAGAGGRA
jgi:CMP-N-acetylneuraminic acid synthetase